MGQLAVGGAGADSPRYWAFQWYETGIYLALALILAELCFLRIRPVRSARPDIRHPRTRQPTPALQSSP
jgi:hypothetical protein